MPIEEGAHKPRGRVYIKELGEIVNRAPHTIRCWQLAQNGKPPILPRRLWPRRDGRRWRYWTPAQVDEIVQWMEQEKIRPGRGLEHYNPSVDQEQEVLAALRAPRPDRRKEREED